MTKHHQGAPDTSHSTEHVADRELDPRSTDHPTGTEQAGENVEEESPS
jgi:hypothetical protein